MKESRETLEHMEYEREEACVKEHTGEMGWGRLLRTCGKEPGRDN